MSGLLSGIGFIGQILSVVAYIWTFVIWYNVSGLLAAFFSLFFPFLSPLWGSFIFWVTGEPEIAAEFFGPNLLNLSIFAGAILIVISSRK